MNGNGSPQIVVLSDMHFGDEGALLTSDKKVDRLIEELESIRASGGIDLLVLLGDVWDQWATDLKTAVERSSLFFSALAKWNVKQKIIIVAGNHDHHIRTFSAAKRRMQMLDWKPKPQPPPLIEGLVPPLQIQPQGDTKETFSVKKLKLKLYYPELRLRVNGKDVLLIHGHHLDFFVRSFWWMTTSLLARYMKKPQEVHSYEDIDRMNEPLFELLTCSGRVSEMVQKEYFVLNSLRLLSKLLRLEPFKSGMSPQRYKEVEDKVEQVRELQERILGDYIPDLFVFGHTHAEGFAPVEVGKNKFLLANSGCFFNEIGRKQTPGAYLLINDKARLRRLGKPPDPKVDDRDYPPP